MIADCPPDYALPAAGPVPLSDIFGRLDAAEDALAICRARLAALRSIPKPKHTNSKKGASTSDAPNGTAGTTK